MDLPRPLSFPVTQWTAMVDMCRSEDPENRRRALESLCGNYWYPLYAFARRTGCGPQDAEDMTQGFFGHMLERDIFGSASQELGKLRTFLLTVFQRYMSDVKTREQALKRGGGMDIFSLDAQGGEERYVREPSSAADPELLYDRAWALSVLAAALSDLRAGEAAADRLEQYVVLEPFLNPLGMSGAGYKDAGARLGMSAETAGKAVSRLRVKLRDCLRRQIADTLRNPVSSQVDEELSALRATLRQ